MSKVRVSGFSLSMDGYGAGPDQDIDNPLGVRGHEMFEWFFQTEAFCIEGHHVESLSQ